jgi:hypothetical protein
MRLFPPRCGAAQLCSLKSWRSAINLAFLHRSVKRPKLSPADRFLWAGLYAVWNDWRSNIFLVKAAIVIGWASKGLSPVLDLENSVRQAGTTCGGEGSPRLDSYDEPR